MFPLIYRSFVAAILAALPVLGQTDVKKKESEAATDSPEIALKKMRVAPGLRAEVWAAEPLLMNPVALAFDDQGRAFVAETGRRRSSVPDIRVNESWRIENLALRSVAERIAFLKGQYPEGSDHGNGAPKDFNGDGQRDWHDLEVETERIKLVVDSNGDGKADRATVFADGFKSLATGIGAGVCVRGNTVFYTCVPDVWRFDGELDGIPQARTTLLSGFGVHITYSGHDMHGVKFGPDGKLYWTIADCGAHVTTREGTVIDNPDSGAVFRCNPDGSAMELFATGLRNPQSLAFNEVGDLFTGDNNADGGDAARWTHVVQGADYGWRIGWQFLPKLGAWNTEGMWHMDVAQTNLAVLPPVAHIGHGPAGIVYYPGTGLPEKYRDHFFMADFPGGIRAFHLVPKGASYALDGLEPKLAQDNSAQQMSGKVLWSLYPSDVAFAPGGGLYVLDWVYGWEKTGKGRIFRVFNPTADTDALTQETKRLLNDGMAKRSDEEIVKLLGHADQRVRLAAEFTLVDRNADQALLKEAMSGTKRLARLHAIWGYAQSLRQSQLRSLVEIKRRREEWERWWRGIEELMKRDPVAAKKLIPVCDIPVPDPLVALTEERMGKLALLLADKDSEIAAQAAKGIADIAGRYLSGTEPEVGDALLKAIKHESPRVRFFAAQTLGRLKVERAQWALLEMLKTNNDDDPFIRHAAVVALSQCVNEEDLLRRSWTNDTKIQAGTLLAMRRKSAFLDGHFLNGSGVPQFQLEAARAIHDKPFQDALPRLAGLLQVDQSLPPEFQQNIETDDWRVAATYRRAVNAAYRIGDQHSASLLAEAAASSKFGLAIRLDALEALEQWSWHLGRDRILGVAIPGEPEHKAEDATAAVASVTARLLAEPHVADEESDALRAAALEAIGANRVETASDLVVALAGDRHASGKVRAAALRALDAMDSPRLEEILLTSLRDADKTLLEAARQIAANVSPQAAVALNADVLGKGSVREQQAALATIAAQPEPAADGVLAEQLDRLLAGRLPGTLCLDLLDSAAKREDETVKRKLASYEALRKKDDPLAAWRECLEGGDAKIGKDVFHENAAAACLRCHKVRGEGGDVGPDLAGIASRHDREYILRSIVDPNAVIAPGYDNVMITLKNGSIVTGLLSAESATTLTLKSLADGKAQRIVKAEIKERTGVPSAMPPGLADVLGKRDLRNVVEFLSELK